jgi:hypothetical protein
MGWKNIFFVLSTSVGSVFRKWFIIPDYSFSKAYSELFQRHGFATPVPNISGNSG